MKAKFLINSSLFFDWKNEKLSREASTVIFPPFQTKISRPDLTELSSKLLSYSFSLACAFAKVIYYTFPWAQLWTARSQDNGIGTLAFFGPKSASNVYPMARPRQSRHTFLSPLSLFGGRRRLHPDTPMPLAKEEGEKGEQQQHATFPARNRRKKTRFSCLFFFSFFLCEIVCFYLW